MERRAKGKGYKNKSGVPFMGTGMMMIPKMHERAHSKMGMDKSEKVLNTKEEPLPIENNAPAKGVDNKKEE